MKSLSPVALLLASITTTVHSLPTLQGRYQQEDVNGAVASETDICSKIGINLMRQGGNAADAMVGTAICVGTVGMYHTGIGGGGFMLIRSEKGEYEFVDFREMAPAAAYEDMFVNKTELSMYGGLASGVPGELRGLEYLHTKYGKLRWQKLIEPSIRLARYGFYVNKDHVKYFKMAQDMAGRKFLTEDPSWALDFAPNGTLVGAGDIMYRKRFADTLETIANEGAGAFYEGKLANLMVQNLQRDGGIMTLQDLKNYTVAIRKPAHSTYRGYKLWGTSAPSSGAVTQAVLKVLEGYEGMGDPAKRNESTHALVEAMRFGYAMRAELGDPLYVDGLDAYQESMLTEATAAEIRSKINFQRTLNVSEYNPKGLESLDTPGTAQMSSADNNGLAISLTSTINLLFGSAVMDPVTGVIMNNEMNDFSIPGSSNAFGYIPSPANFIKPFKRPLSSTTPTIIEDSQGKLYLVVGAAGGSRIISATIQNIHNVIDRGDTVAQALARPRVHDQLTPNVCNLEYSYDNGTAEYLRSLGHNISYVAPGQSAAQAVRLLGNGTFEAAGEPRQFNSGGYAF
ncbi:Gamma-glutamyltranspeptidase [Dactylellina cionopaga]|nr:Gamma-glutamyltranspeptidase [Dactylellina cionopaga]